MLRIPFPSKLQEGKLKKWGAEENSKQQYRRKKLIQIGTASANIQWRQDR